MSKFNIFTNQLAGLVIDLANVLAKHLEFNIHYKVTRTWGNLLTNGTLIGTRGDVRSFRS